ncbi:helical membrane plugin domain-containing protein [Planifilum fimeticola]
MGDITWKRDRAGDEEEDALRSMTLEMVGRLAERGAVALELLDDILQPETLSLLRRLPEASDSLYRVLDLVQRLEESGALSSLAELAELLARLRSTWTGPMAADAAEKAGKAVEAADDLVQKGFPELAHGILTAVESAREELRGAGDSPSLFRLLRSMSDPEVREGIRFMLSFAKALSKGLKDGQS